MKWRWLPWLKQQDNDAHDAVIAKVEAAHKLEKSRVQTQQVEALAERLHEQIHRRNQLGKMFDEAFRGIK